MSGGGDTPSTKTLWSLNYGGDGFIFGQFQDGKLFVEGPSEDKMCIAGPPGKILGFESFYPELEPLFMDEFEQYFGEIESVKILIVEGLSVGDDIPNWEDYELLNP